MWSVGSITYDAKTQTNFTLKAMMMWCIHDFLAYGHVSGCWTAGQYGCPVCGEEIDSKWLKYGIFFTYMGHRRFIRDSTHSFRL